MGLIKLSELLEKGMPGITSKKVKLVRHKDGRGEIIQMLEGKAKYPVKE